MQASDARTKTSSRHPQGIPNVSATVYKSALLFGAPGVGKGTQGEILGSIPGFHHFSMGDAFRNLDPESDLAKEVRTYSSKGELVPDPITIKLWNQDVADRVLAGNYNPETELLLLDGIPRNTDQADLLADSLDVLAVIHLTTKDQDALFDRLAKRALKQGRADDAKQDVIKRRWDIYQDETQPVLAKYPKSIVHDLDAMGTPAEVLGKILDVLAPIQAKGFASALG